MQPNTNAREMQLVEVTSDTWPKLEELFEGRGGPKYCWCMAWRRQQPDVRKLRSTERNRALKGQFKCIVDAGAPVGILLLSGGEPIGWCSVAPYETYRGLRGRGGESAAGKGVWSIACFFLRREQRGTGCFDKLLAGAVETAWRRGARIVEAYPVLPDSPSFKFMGLVPNFQKHGFRQVGMAGRRRRIMQIERPQD